MNIGGLEVYEVPGMEGRENDGRVVYMPPGSKIVDAANDGAVTLIERGCLVCNLVTYTSLEASPEARAKVKREIVDGVRAAGGALDGAAARRARRDAKRAEDARRSRAGRKSHGASEM